MKDTVEIFVPLLALLIVFVAAVGAQSVMAEPSKAFHAPETSSEIALQEIVQTLSQDDSLLSALIGRGTPTREQEEKADHGLTDKLLQSWRAKEQRAVSENCGGAYREGEICGLDYDPFFCVQDRPDGPLFMQSAQSTDNSAKIAVAWDKDGQVVATYDMVRTGSVWKVDNVRCVVERAAYKEDKDDACSHDVRRNGPCFDVQGTLSVAANLRAYLRAENPPRRYALAFVSEDEEAPLSAPQSVRSLLSPTQDVRGLFNICSLGKPQKGIMQSVCIAQADKVGAHQSIKDRE